MDKQQVGDLLKKYNEGTLNPAEKTALDTWYLKYATESNHELSEEQQKELSNRLRSALPLQYPVKSSKLWPFMAAAAIAVLLLAVGLWFNQSGHFFSKNAALTVYTNDVLPGKTGATLTLANGTQIDITKLDAGKLASEAGVSISKTADGQIIYEILGQTDLPDNRMNTLQTAIGQQAQIQLPDGSRVYLNAGSSLKYPFSFAGMKKRSVELSGEGFFEVKKEPAHPFTVRTGIQEVEVLGTTFNINTHLKDQDIKTTLIEGSVRIADDAGHTDLLKPGQEATVTSRGIRIADVETEYAIAWKKGYFLFNNESLDVIMQKLALWYNIEPVYEDPSLKDRVFFGSLSKSENISTILHAMERTDVARFEISGKKIIIHHR